jgi:L-rhamnose isomerase
MKYRQRLIDSLDSIYSERLSNQDMYDAIEGKLFGIGSETFVVGSHDFYYGYAMKKGLVLTMDMGHYHPTESVADKISAILPFTNKILLHVSRGVRWDSDHIVLQNDELDALCEEIIRSGRMNDIFIALDYFDASVNRIGAWVLGMRNSIKGLMKALLQPIDTLRELEEEGNNFKKMALLEEFKNLPYGAIWDHYCEMKGVPTGSTWIKDIEDYEKSVLKLR